MGFKRGCMYGIWRPDLEVEKLVSRTKRLRSDLDEDVLGHVKRRVTLVLTLRMRCPWTGHG